MTVFLLNCHINSYIRSLFQLDIEITSYEQNLSIPKVARVKELRNSLKNYVLLDG